MQVISLLDVEVGGGGGGWEGPLAQFLEGQKSLHFIFPP